MYETSHICGAQQGGLEAGHDIALGDRLGALRELLGREAGAHAPQHLQDEPGGADAPRDAADQRQDALLGACEHKAAQIRLLQRAEHGLCSADLCAPAGAV